MDKEPSIMVREPDATMQPAPQDNQLMSKHRLLSFKPQLRLEWRGQDGQNETEQPDHSASLGDSTTSSTQIRFSVHTPASFRSAFGRLRFHQVRSLSSLFLKGFRRFVAGGFQPIAGFRMLSDYVSYISRVFSGDPVAFGGPSVEEPEAGQIRAEQFTVVLGHTLGMMVANACNAVVLAMALWYSPDRGLAAAWAALMIT